MATGAVSYEMTREQAKEIVLGGLRPRMEVIEMGFCRFFLAARYGKLLQCADAVYFTTISEAQYFADRINEDIKAGKAFS